MANVHAYGFLVTFLVFLLSPLFKLSYVQFAEARKLANSNGVFSFDLIHRHSPLSPYYNASMTRRELLKRAPLGAISPSHKIHLSSKHTNKGVVQSLNVEPDYYFGEHYIKFTLGTPQVEQYGVADTGSSLIWVQCSPCKKCIPQELPIFDPTTSSTFHKVPCASKTCNNTSLSLSCPSKQNATIRSNSLPCNYDISYGDGANSTGVLAMDTFGFDTTTSLPSSIFGCGYNQNGNHEGIVGLGTGSTSLISQLGPKVNYKFSYCLTPLSSGVTSKLNFGVDVTDPAVVSTPFTTGNGFTDNHYHLTLDSISIKVKDNPIKIHMPVALDIIIDSGTTLTYLPQSVYDSVKEAVANAIELTPIRCPVSNYELCYGTNLTDASAKLNAPDVVFHFRGADVVLKTYNLFWEINDNVITLAMIPSESLYLFGNVAQVNYHVEYDLQAKQVSFAPTNCTKQ